MAVISHSTVIGILPVKRARGQIFKEIKYDGECFSCNVSHAQVCHQCLCNDLEEGNFSNCIQGVYKDVLSQNLYNFMLLFSLS